MNMKLCMAYFLICVLCGGVQLHAQPTGSGQESFTALKTRAENGDINAQRGIGIDYYYGTGVDQDYVEALKWLRRLAEQGDTCSEELLGGCYSFGLGVAHDDIEAVKWHRKAAEKGWAVAQFNLACAYESGEGIAKDFVEAVKWYRKAAEQGDAPAQNNLGLMYMRGTGVETNEVESFKWELRAANQNNANAQYVTGLYYLGGTGVLKDYAEAYKWLNLASAQGDKHAKEWLYKLEQTITPEQITEGQRRSAVFIPHKEIAGQQTSNSNASTSTANPKFTGTGFFITDDGYLISNYHVVKGAAKVRLLTGAGLIDTTVVKVDAANDLALLKAAGKFAPLPIAASRTVKLGGTVATVGFPDIGLQGFAPKLAKGEIASLAGAADDPRYFQISLPVQPGNSGGALVDAHGNVVGIVAAKLDASVALAATGSLPENVNYAVKSSLLLSFLESVPDVSAKLKDPNTKDEPFEDVVKSAQDAAVLVLVY